MFHEVMQNCRQRGLTPLKFGKNRDVFQKDRQYVYMEGFSAENILKAAFVRLRFRKFWNEFYRSQKFYSKENFSLLEDAITREIKKRALDIIVNAKAIETIVKNYDVKLFFIWNDALWWERLCVEMGHRHGVPSFQFQHGVMSPLVDEFTMIISDKIGVWGPLAREQFVEGGVASERLAVVGHPYLNELDKKYTKHNSAGRPIKRDSVKANILFVGMPHPAHRTYYAPLHYEEGRLIFEYVMDACRQIPDVRLSVKTRGGEESELYQKWMAGSDPLPDMKIRCDLPIADMMLQADIILLYESTAALEAMIMRKPVILVDIYRELGKIAYVKSQAVLRVHDARSIARAIKYLMQNKGGIRDRLLNDSNNFIVQYAQVGDSRSDQKITDAMEELIVR